MRVKSEDLKGLIKTKLQKAGLNEEHADVAADVLTFADARGIHSHGAMRVEYYAERIAKGGSIRTRTLNSRKQAQQLACFTAMAVMVT